VSLPLLQTGMLGCVTMDVALPCRTAFERGGGLRVFKPRLFWWDGLSGAQGFLKWSHKKLVCE
jgi:hypothetical protein